jgi:hypothetical protein
MSKIPNSDIGSHIFNRKVMDEEASIIWKATEEGSEKRL